MFAIASRASHSVSLVGCARRMHRNHFARFGFAVALAFILSAAVFPGPRAAASPSHMPTSSVALSALPPAVVRNSNGKLQVFVAESDYQIWTREQNCAGCGWGSWQALGGLHADGWPVAGLDANGVVNVFVLGKANGDQVDYLYHDYEICADCGWNPWVRISSNTIGTLGGPLTIGQNGDGRLEVFLERFIGADALFLFHAWENCTNCSGDYSALTPFPTQLSNGYVDNLGAGVGTNSDGRLEVIASDKTNNKFHSYQCSGCGGGWSGWSALSAADGQSIADAGVGRSQDGRLDVFTKRSDGTVATSWETSASCSTCWTQNWLNLGGSFGTDPGAGEVTVGLNSDGRQEIFINGTDNKAHNKWQTCAGCGWISGWGNLGGSIVSSLGVGQDTDGRLEILAQGTGGDVQLNFQVCAGCNWNGWVSLGSG